MLLASLQLHHESDLSHSCQQALHNNTAASRFVRLMKNGSKVSHSELRIFTQHHHHCSGQYADLSVCMCICHTQAGPTPCTATLEHRLTLLMCVCRRGRSGGDIGQVLSGSQSAMPGNSNHTPRCHLCSGHGSVCQHAHTFAQHSCCPSAACKL